MQLDDIIALLTRTPAMLDTLLRDLPETWTHHNEGGETWSAYDIVGHLIHGEVADWIPRAQRVLEFGESKAFDPFDRLAQFQESAGKSLNELLDEFARLREQSLIDLRSMNLTADDLARTGLHPSLGTVTLSHLLHTWPAHDLTHLHQLSRVLAHQVRDDVGPWAKFMGVLQCQGHSE